MMVSVHVRLWSHAFISKSEAGTKLIPTLNELMERDGANGHLRYHGSIWQPKLSRNLMRRSCPKESMPPSALFPRGCSILLPRKNMNEPR
jgi:hypothetical protein